MFLFGKMEQLQKSEIVDYHQEVNNDRIPDVTPGEILREEFLKPMNISAYKLAKDTICQPQGFQKS